MFPAWGFSPFSLSVSFIKFNIKSTIDQISGCFLRLSIQRGRRFFISSLPRVVISLSAAHFERWMSDGGGDVDVQVYA